MAGYDDYDAYGQILPGRSSNNGLADCKYKFTGKERDVETSLDYFGARYYDSWRGQWLSVDPMAEKYPGWSPYNYAVDNPLAFVDPNGDSTFVVNNDDRTYTVTGGNLSGKNDDTGIYTQNSDGTVTLVGNSITTHSFFGDDNKAVIGAVIDMSSTEGQDFINNEIIKADPFLIWYMFNATGSQKYDFKSRGIDTRPSGLSRDAYRYRGSVAASGLIGSARDFGNMGAGIVAGRSGLSWLEARLGFDALESFQRRQIATEGTPTQKAQWVGYRIGVLLKILGQ